MKSILRKTNNNEIRTLAKIYKIEFSKPPYNEKWTLSKAIKKINIFTNLYDCYTITYDNQIVGFIVINPTFMCPGIVAFGEDIVIKKEFQGKGIGTWVLRNIQELYKKKELQIFYGNCS